MNQVKKMLKKSILIGYQFLMGISFCILGPFVLLAFLPFGSDAMEAAVKFFFPTFTIG